MDSTLSCAFLTVGARPSLLLLLLRHERRVQGTGNQAAPLFRLRRSVRADLRIVVFATKSGCLRGGVLRDQWDVTLPISPRSGDLSIGAVTPAEAVANTTLSSATHPRADSGGRGKVRLGPQFRGGLEVHPATRSSSFMFFLFSKKWRVGLESGVQSPPKSETKSTPPLKKAHSFNRSSGNHLATTSPSSRGPGHRPFTAVTRVRISVGTHLSSGNYSCFPGEGCQLSPFSPRSGGRCSSQPDGLVHCHRPARRSVKRFQNRRELDGEHDLAGRVALLDERLR